MNGVAKITQVTNSMTSRWPGLLTGKPSSREADNIETPRVNSLKAQDPVLILSHICPLSYFSFLISIPYFHSVFFHFSPTFSLILLSVSHLLVCYNPPRITCPLSLTFINHVFPTIAFLVLIVSISFQRTE